jgi:hypothetical protein
MQHPWPVTQRLPLSTWLQSRLGAKSKGGFASWNLLFFRKYGAEAGGRGGAGSGSDRPPAPGGPHAPLTPWATAAPGAWRRRARKGGGRGRAPPLIPAEQKNGLSAPRCYQQAPARFCGSLHTLQLAAPRSCSPAGAGTAGGVLPGDEGWRRRCWSWRSWS